MSRNGNYLFARALVFIFLVSIWSASLLGGAKHNPSQSNALHWNDECKQVEFDEEHYHKIIDAYEKLKAQKPRVHVMRVMQEILFLDDILKVASDHLFGLPKTPLDKINKEMKEILFSQEFNVKALSSISEYGEEADYDSDDDLDESDYSKAQKIRKALASATFPYKKETCSALALLTCLPMSKIDRVGSVVTSSWEYKQFKKLFTEDKSNEVLEKVKDSILGFETTLDSPIVRVQLHLLKRAAGFLENEDSTKNT